VFWGNLWGTTATSSELIGKINEFFTDILVSPLVDQLAEYNVSGQKIEHGTFAGSKAAPRQTASASFCKWGAKIFPDRTVALFVRCFRRTRGGEFLEARIKHRIEPEQRRSERGSGECAKVRYRE